LMSRRHLAVVAVVLALAPAARASDPVGIYAVVDKVMLSPSTGPAERIQIWGVFALAQGRGGDDYSPPMRGYMSFTLVKGKENVHPLASAAGPPASLGVGRPADQPGRRAWRPAGRHARRARRLAGAVVELQHGRPLLHPSAVLPPAPAQHPVLALPQCAPGRP